MTEERHDTLPRDERVGDVLAAYLEALDAGWAPPRAQLLARYPELAPGLEAFFANGDRVDRSAEPLRAAAGLPPSRSADPTLAEGEPAAPRAWAGGRVFGDYELRQEVARGGMGVVYQAPAGQPEPGRGPED